MKEVVQWQKLSGIFQYTLNPGVQEEEFERFVTEEVTKAPFPSVGMRMRFLKCNVDSQDDLIGTYATVFEFESVELRDKYFPTVSETSAAFNQWWAEHGALWAKYHSMIDGRYIDYIMYGENEGMA
jgi:hypothetical protein